MIAIATGDGVGAIRERYAPSGRQSLDTDQRRLSDREEKNEQQS
ncbi:MAG TPA: hypothetical protein VJX67_01470 [Blastocatellia bacterium]|nr:hypothetical protein [Blastocatellia bacterium]